MRLTKLKYPLFAALSVAAVTLSAVAEDSESSTTSGVDVEEVAFEETDFGKEFLDPVIPKKQREDICNHISDLRKAIEKKGLKTELDRDGEVIMIELPCSDLFSANDTVLKESGQRKLDFMHHVLKYPTMYKVLVATYSDDTGEPDYCFDLTTKRSESVAKYFQSISEVAEANVHPFGMGQDGFIVDNTTIANRNRNRRVEIYIIPEWQMIDTAKAGKLKKS